MAAIRPALVSRLSDEMADLLAKADFGIQAVDDDDANFRN